MVDPIHEIVTLDDYRKRHALYKTDKDLQLLHSSKAMVPVWDDHEFTNNSWKYGAEIIPMMKVYLVQRIERCSNGTYYEWMPYGVMIIIIF